MWHTAPEAVGGQPRELPKRVSDRLRGPRLDHEAEVRVPGYHLIRRDLHDHVVPGQIAADLARRRSLVRARSRPYALL